MGSGIRDFLGEGVLIEFEQLKATLGRPQSPYEVIKVLEGRFPVPSTSTVVDVGVLDNQTGAFSGLTSTTTYVPPGEFNQKPYAVTTPPVVDIDAVTAVLSFRIANRLADFEVTVDGQTVSAPPGASLVQIDVGRSGDVEWRLRAGPDEVHERLRLRRPPIIGGGSFRLPAFPVTVIYEPPADQELKNHATYQTATTIGTSSTASFSEESSSTEAVSAAYWHLDEFRSQLESWATVVATVGAVAGGGGGAGTVTATSVSKALGVFAGAIGRASATQTTGLEVTQEHAVSSSETAEDGISTGPNSGGPGKGDLVVFLRDVQLAWLADGGSVSLAVLDHGRVAITTVATLQQDLADGTGDLDADVLEALLALDPFVAGGPGAALPTDRFAFVGAYELNGTAFSKAFAHTVTAADRKATASFETVAEDLDKGFLSFMGLGVPETSSTVMTTTHSSSVVATTSETAKITLHLHATDDERYGVEVYYDRVFGTFAVRELDLLDGDAITGSVEDAAGRQLAGHLVTVVTGARTYTTHTDDRGQYSFRARGLVNSQCAVRVGDDERQVVLDDARRPSAVDMRPSVAVRPKRPRR